MAIKRHGAGKIRGLSSDTKPANSEDGAEYTESNTGKVFDYSTSTSTWTERSRSSDVTANTAKISYSTAASNAVAANTSKVSLTDNSVTLAKLAHGTADKYLGFNGSGVPAELTVSGIPSGCIVMWSGAIAAIPATWYLCDGNNSTPNLADKFIRSGSGVGSTGGADTVSLSTAELASHTHTQTAHTHSQSAHTHSQPAHTHTQPAHTHTQDAHGHTGSTNSTGSHSHTFSSAGRGPYSSPNGSHPDEALWASGNTGSAGNHSHTVTVADGTAVNQSTTATNSSTTATNSSTTASNSNTTAVNANAGSGSAHQNMPAYYTLAYIMKA